MRERTKRRQQEQAEKKARNKVIKAQFNSDKDKSFAFVYSPESHDAVSYTHLTLPTSDLV